MNERLSYVQLFLLSFLIFNVLFPFNRLASLSNYSLLACLSYIFTSGLKYFKLGKLINHKKNIMQSLACYTLASSFQCMLVLLTLMLLLLGEHSFKYAGTGSTLSAHSGEVRYWKILSRLQLLGNHYVKQKGNSLNYTLCSLLLDPLTRKRYI